MSSGEQAMKAAVSLEGAVDGHCLRLDVTPTALAVTLAVHNVFEKQMENR
jgi:hypothetical protein